jgi:streptogramin lyase
MGGDPRLDPERKPESILPTLLPRRRGWAALIASAIAIAVAGGAVILFVLLSGGRGGRTGPNHVPGRGGGLQTTQASVVALDPRTRTVTAHAPVDLGLRRFSVAGKLTIGEGALWVTSTAGQTQLLKADPTTGRVTHTIVLSNLRAFGTPQVATGDGRVWTLAGNTIYRTDPVTDTSTPIGPLEGTPTGLVVTHGAIWVSTQEGALARIDLGSRRVTATYSVGASASGVVVGGGDVWVSDTLQGVVYRFDPVKKKVVQTITLPGGADAIAAGRGGIWVVDRTAGTVVRIDEKDGSVSPTIRVGRQPFDVAVGAGAVWVANSGEGTISRIDPASMQVSTIRVASSTGPDFITAAPGSVWMTFTTKPPAYG